jgi:hypothetical protein
VIGIIGDPRRDGHGSFADLIAYCEKNGRAAYVGMQNINFPEHAASEMASLAFQNTRCKEPLMHIILSWREMELPTDGQVDEAVKIALKELDLQDCQAVWICQEIGVDYGGTPAQEKLAQSWAKSIQRNPRELFRAARDAGKAVETVLQDMENGISDAGLAASWQRAKQQREAQLQEAAAQKAGAQRAEELLSGAASIPRGADFNLPNANLSPEQEAVMSSIDKAHTEIKAMRAAATAKETANAPSPVAAAIQSAKQKMGPVSFVTNAVTGRTYTGKILEIAGHYPDTVAIQKIAGNQAVLHRIKDISANTNISVGADLSITKEKDGKAYKITVKTMSEIEKAEKAQAQSISERERDR